MAVIAFLLRAFIVTVPRQIERLQRTAGLSACLPCHATMSCGLVSIFGDRFVASWRDLERFIESRSRYSCWPCSAMQARYVSLSKWPHRYCLYVEAATLHS